MRFKSKLIFAVIFMLFCCCLSQAYANIILKIVAVNPSKEYKQKVPVKIYLPKESKPEDIVDKGGLDVGYDTQQGSYYVFGEYELAPSEVMELEIVLNDIWVIPTGELESIRVEAEKINGLLKGTEFVERIEFLFNTMIKKLDEIQAHQQTTRANPEDHISQYRYDLKLFESVKADLAIARGMLGKTGAFSGTKIWKIILFIIIFLGILGFVFYLFWYKQAKLLNEAYTPQEDIQEEVKPKEEYQAEKSPDQDDDLEKLIKGK